MSIHQNHDERPEELDWLAFLYVSGELPELPADELEAFELRLLDDQAAREAVAQAVELSCGIVLAESRSEVDLQPASVAAPAGMSRSGRTWVSRVTWMSLGASAALVLLLAWIQFQPAPDRDEQPAPQDQALADVWSQTRESIRDIVQVDEPGTFDVEDEVEQVAASPLPSWMAAAVFGDEDGEGDMDGDGIPEESWDDERLEN